MMLYHFLTSPLVCKKTNAKDNFEQILSDGAILCANLRNNSPRGALIPDLDHPKDKNYVFLTTKKDLALTTIDVILKYRKDMVDLHAYGFGFDNHSFRNKEGVFFRYHDALIDRHKRRRRRRRGERWDHTKPFTNQHLTEECEILVEGMIDINLAKLYMKDGIWFERP